MPASASHVTVDLDDLLVGSHILAALEVGRFEMHPDDFREIAAWLAAILHRLPTPALERLRREGPRTLVEMAENALSDRGELRWNGGWQPLVDARMLCDATLARLKAPRT